MSIINKFERCEADDPNRCQGVGKGGQCPYKAVEGSSYCWRHGANKQLSARSSESQRLYKLALWSDRIGTQADHPKVKSLREEAGILRMTLEARLDSCKDAQSLLMASGSITELVREITKTVEKCHNLEKATGAVLDRTQAMEWVQEIGEILSRYIGEPEILEMIAEDMTEALERRTSGTQS